MDSTTGPIIAIACFGVFALVFTVVGIIMIVRSRQDKNKLQQSLSWPSVDGTVLESRVITSPSTDDDGGVDTYRPYVKYEYEVGGTKYTHDKMRLGMVFSTSKLKTSQEAVVRYPVGRAVKVFVNPANPADSVLEQKGSSTATLIIGIVLLVIGLCVGIPGAIGLLISVVRVSSGTGG
ncbi:MAG: DUF3592 domain-containing protein [Chloroflexi bacterium]|nr:MAG: DUF3592 domain-containing protein [Chloroflexota bacterium]